MGSFNHTLKNLGFTVFEQFLTLGDTNASTIDGNKIKRILLIRPEKIGDLFVSFPVIDTIKEKYPQIKFSVLGSKHNLPLIKNDPRFEKIYLYKKAILEDYDTIRAIRRDNYDCVIDMVCDDSSTALYLTQLAAKGKPRIGVGKRRYKRYYDYNYDHRLNNTGQMISNSLQVVQAFGIDPATADGFSPPFIDEDSDRAARAFVGSLDDTKILVGYNLSAGGPTRIWKIEKSVKLLNILLDSDPNIQIILFTTPDDRHRGEEVLAKFSERVRLVPDKLPLIGASAIIKYLDFMLTPDTSLVHIARSFRVRVVALYNKFMENYKLWRPYKQEYGAVVSGNDYDIHDITPEQVFAEFQKVRDNE